MVGDTGTWFSSHVIFSKKEPQKYACRIFALAGQIISTQTQIQTNYWQLAGLGAQWSGAHLWLSDVLNLVASMLIILMTLWRLQSPGKEPHMLWYSCLLLCLWIACSLVYSIVISSVTPSTAPTSFLKAEHWPLHQGNLLFSNSAPDTKPWKLLGSWGFRCCCILSYVEGAIVSPEKCRPWNHLLDLSKKDLLSWNSENMALLGQAQNWFPWIPWYNL